MSDNIRYFEATIPAGQSRTIAGPANFLRVEDSNGPLNVSFDHAPSVPIRGGSRLEQLDPWSLAFVTNNQTYDIKARIKYGAGIPAQEPYSFTPTTINDGETIVFLAVAGEHVISGVNSAGQRRQYFSIYLRPAVTGSVLVYNNRTGKLICIVSASTGGGGNREYTDDDIKIVNRTSGALSTEGATPDIAVSQNFYR